MSTNDRVEFACPHCQKTLQVKAGRKISGPCPACGKDLAAGREAAIEHAVQAYSQTIEAPRETNLALVAIGNTLGIGLLAGLLVSIPAAAFGSSGALFGLGLTLAVIAAVAFAYLGRVVSVLQQIRDRIR